MSEPMAIVLAAGKGTRMNADVPKVLVPVLGRPMVRYVIEALRDAGVVRQALVVGYRQELMRAELAGEGDITFVEQAEQLGTGHAVLMCRTLVAGHDGPVVIVAGDSPMLQASSVRELLAEYQRARPACLVGTACRDDPHGLGRIVRDGSGSFVGIVEEKDATPEQRAIKEVNMSTYVFRPDALLSSLERLTNANSQSEYYVTDCPGLLRDAGETVVALAALKPCEALSINTVNDLEDVEAEMRRMAAPSA